jgi:uncharacterized protein
MSLLAILLFGGTLALSFWATMRVRQVYDKFSRLPASSGSSGAETAATILRQEGIYDVEIVEHDEMLGDHYDPIHKRLVLSRDNFHGTSTAALGVAAHECGHAIQHKQAYALLQWRMTSVGLTMFASQIVLWLPLLGMFTGFLNTGAALILVASAWGILMLFNLITLPVEFDASARARLVLKQTGLIQTIEEETRSRKYYGQRPGPTLPRSSRPWFTSCCTSYPRGPAESIGADRRLGECNRDAVSDTR